MSDHAIMIIWVMKIFFAERFAGASDKGLMTAAGDAVVRLAMLEQEYGDFARADALRKAFLRNYTDHVNAPNMAASMGHKLLSIVFQALCLSDLIP